MTNAYEQWLPCDVVVDADPRATVVTVTGIIKHIREHMEAEGADVAQLTWTCQVRVKPYPVYVIRAA